LLKTKENTISFLGKDREIESQDRFLKRVAQEWRRSERSNRPSLLVLFHGLEDIPGGRDRIVAMAASTFRDTDVFGWYKTGTTLGVICVELGKSRVEDAEEAIVNKITGGLVRTGSSLRPEITITIHLLPPYTGTGALDDADAEFAQALWKTISPESRAEQVTKRALDICGSAFLLLLLLPILLVIAACIKFTSRGPALFRQARAGLGGRTFDCYKFRTMFVDMDDRKHLEYVQQFIQGKAQKHVDANGQAIYKLTNDRRITPLGRLLRRTSLDELPQLWNVLMGNMTLVGPRPPLPYEVKCYDLWHRRRVFELKPGLTGLWQVRGRSRCSFDEMIRLDLQHGKPNSLSLYLRVLLETPGAVISGGGAQ
jgi:lipopolysaccharide/colanic/teichoic acid biosynthesis glycosyltransferase